MADIEFDHVLVLGLGLIGGSLALALAERGAASVRGWSPSKRTRSQAVSAGLDVADDLDRALSEAPEALIVLAAPLPAFPELLARISAYCPQVALTDVGSVKAPVSQLVAQITPQARFVGGHPMAGSELSGFAAANAELFESARWVLTGDDDTDVDLWAAVARLALSVGAQVVPTTDSEHDAAVAAISHLPHLLALALAQVGGEAGPLAASLAAGSFRDGTRVAASSAELIQAMCQTNHAALIPVLDRALTLLGQARSSLATTGSVADYVAASQAAMTTCQGTGLTLQLPLTMSELLQLGRTGHYLAGLA